MISFAVLASMGIDPKDTLQLVQLQTQTAQPVAQPARLLGPQPVFFGQIVSFLFQGDTDIPDVLQQPAKVRTLAIRQEAFELQGTGGETGSIKVSYHVRQA